MNWAKNVERSAVGEKFIFFFNFLKSFQKWRKEPYFHFRTSKIKRFTHLDEKCAHVRIKPKMLTGPRWAKTSNVWIFSKGFKIEENQQIFTSTQLKYKNSLIWRRNVHMYDCAKNVDTSGSGRKLQFFRFFLKVFGIEENHHIFTSTQLKYKKFTHLEEKCAHVWTAPKMSTGPRQVRGGRKLQFVDFFKSFQDWRKTS